MINDLETKWNTIKYVDDTTVYHISQDPNDNQLQDAVSVAETWSRNNDMRLNAAKTKEMVVCFAKNPPDLPSIVVDNTEVECVSNCTLLGVELQDNLSWDMHCQKIVKKGNSRLFFLKQLKRAKLEPNDILDTYLAIVRPVLEYACQVWHPGLTEEQRMDIEKIQERALRIAFPALSYEQACNEYNVPTLQSRRTDLCKKLFIDMQKDNHPLHNLLPPQRRSLHNTRHAKPYPLPRVFTDRYKDTFVPFCLFNCQ